MYPERKGRLAGLLMWLGVLMSLVMLVACSKKQDEPLRLSSSPWPGYEPLYLARDLGYLTPGKVNLFELPSSDISMESFRNRSADLATLTLDETLDLLQAGVKLRVVLVLDISHGGDAVLARPDIKTLADLRGKRISIVNIPLGLYMLSRTLETAGIERDEVTVFPMAENRQEAFYLQGHADAVITFDPVKARLMAAGAHVLFDSSRIPNEIFDLLVVHEDVYQQRQADVCALVGEWFRALDYMRTDREDAARRISRRLNMPVTEYDNLMAGIVLPTKAQNRQLLGGPAPAILQPAQRLHDILLQEKILATPVPFESLVDSQFASCFVP